MKKIVDLVLKNQLLTALLILAVVSFGLISFFNTTVDAFPDATDKTVQVITKYEGKASEEVESLLTVPVENELVGLPHSTQMRSETLAGLSVIYVMFDDEIDGFKKTFSKVIDVRKSLMWAGDMILVIYEKIEKEIIKSKGRPKKNK